MSFVTWRGGAAAACVCTAALAWQNANLRGQLARRDTGDAPPAWWRVGADHAAEEAPSGIAAIGSATTRAALSRQGAAELAGDDSRADIPAPPGRHWAVDLLRPRDGEDLSAYRDRVLPIALAVVAPQRLRVSERRRVMTVSAGLDARQQAELDAAVSEASDEIVNRVWQSVATEEIWPRPRASAGVALAADLLTSVAAADRRFRATLSDDQRALVDRSSFDVADYLVFSIPWEERFGIAKRAAPR
jgi:hypothetical protein